MDTTFVRMKLGFSYEYLSLFNRFIAHAAFWVALNIFFISLESVLKIFRVELTD